jgi:hypothetical protein
MYNDKPIFRKQVDAGMWHCCGCYSVNPSIGASSALKAKIPTTTSLTGVPMRMASKPSWLTEAQRRAHTYSRTSPSKQRSFKVVQPHPVY